MTPLFHGAAGRSTRPQVIVDLLRTGFPTQMVFRYNVSEYATLVRRGQDEAAEFLRTGSVQRAAVITLCPVGAKTANNICEEPPQVEKASKVEWKGLAKHYARKRRGGESKEELCVIRASLLRCGLGSVRRLVLTVDRELDGAVSEDEEDKEELIPWAENAPWPPDEETLGKEDWSHLVDRRTTITEAEAKLLGIPADDPIVSGVEV